MVNHRAKLCDLAEKFKPASVRGLYYQAVCAGLVEKTEIGYRKVMTQLTELRLDGTIPFHWIVDGNRRRHHAASYKKASDAFAAAAERYKKSLWLDQPSYCEVWVEKEALTGVLLPVCDEFDVSLMPARGYSSISFLAGAAAEIIEIGKPAYIFHLGDFDPSGVDAGRDIEAKLRRFAPEAEIHFERLAVQPEQILQRDLPARPTKQTDTRAAKFASPQSVELDAIAPDQLREIVRQAISRHMPEDRLASLRAAEEIEREHLQAVLRQMQRVAI
jgi:hypothetical protein